MSTSINKGAERRAFQILLRIMPCCSKQVPKAWYTFIGRWNRIKSSRFGGKVSSQRMRRFYVHLGVPRRWKRRSPFLPETATWSCGFFRFISTNFVGWSGLGSQNLLREKRTFCLTSRHCGPFLWVSWLSWWNPREKTKRTSVAVLPLVPQDWKSEQKTD